jgi:hypothetical protein
MELAVRAAAGLVASGGWLVLMTTSGDVEKLQAAAGDGFSWGETVSLAGSDDRLLALGARNLGVASA